MKTSKEILEIVKEWKTTRPDCQIHMILYEVEGSVETTDEVYEMVKYAVIYEGK